MALFFTQRLLPGPVWLHFLLVGFALYAALALLFPEPRPVLGPPNAARLPTDDDVARFVELELRDELLFREALAAGLHRFDPVIEQRIVRNMRFLDPDTAADEGQLVAQGLALNMHLTDEVIRRRLVQVMTQF
ncbi:MAG: hypothetical protein ACPG63_03355, partial [Luminiphilus sp.]